jgi:post-segregation antitoxin (ccd killing protein)
MPKVSVYLSDELYARAREEGLKLSELTQAAVVKELQRAPNRAWIRKVTSRAKRFEGTIDTTALLAEVRDEFDA